MASLQDHELEELATTKPALFDDAFKILAERAYMKQFEFDFKDGATVAQNCSDFAEQMFLGDLSMMERITSFMAQIEQLDSCSGMCPFRNTEFPLRDHMFLFSGLDHGMPETGSCKEHV